MIRETIEFGLGVALSTVDLLSKRGREFIERGKEVEDRYGSSKRGCLLPQRRRSLS